MRKLTYSSNILFHTNSSRKYLTLIDILYQPPHHTNKIKHFSQTLMGRDVVGKISHLTYVRNSKWKPSPKCHNKTGFKILHGQKWTTRTEIIFRWYLQLETYHLNLPILFLSIVIVSFWSKDQLNYVLVCWQWKWPMTIFTKRKQWHLRFQNFPKRGPWTPEMWAPTYYMAQI